MSPHARSVPHFPSYQVGVQLGNALLCQSTTDKVFNREKPHRKIAAPTATLRSEEKAVVVGTRGCTGSEGNP